MGAGRGFFSLALRLWCLVLFLAFAVVCLASQAVTTLPGDHGVLLPAEGRALGERASTDDYGGPSANPGHDPKPGNGGKGSRKH